MRRFFAGSLAVTTVVALGFFAIAKAQRSGQDRVGAEQTAPAADAEPYQNPLRPPARENPPKNSAVDPFARQEVQPDPAVRTAGGQEAAGAKGRDAPTILLAPAAPAPGPIMPPAAPAPGPDLGNARRGETASDPPGPREPAPFRADPAAAPTVPLLAPLPRNEVAPPRFEATGQTGQDAASTEVSLRADAADAVAAEGVGQPGDKRLEGPQTPQVTIQKLAPPEIQVGRPAVFRVTVRNTGTAPAANVQVSDQVPKGTRLLGTTPRASQGGRGELVWSLGSLAPGEQSSAEMQLMPTAEGEIGSVATVHFDAGATARSVSTRPRLVVETSGTNRVLVGDQAALTFVVSNPGTGVATGVVLEERVPAGLTHPAGGQLEYPIGDLRPGESRKLDLKLKAAQPGQITNVIAVHGDASLRSEHRFNLEVVAPQLDIALAGPKRRYLDREATYQVSVSNPGTAPAQQVELVAYLPPGLRFVGANNAGHYDEATRAVSWRLEELPTNQRGSVELVTLPVEAGKQNIKFRGTALRGLAVEKEQPVVVEGIAAVLFQVAGTRNPIEVGGQTTYEIRVVNQGSKAAGNVRVVVLLPPELKALSAEGPTRFDLQSGQVAFEGLAQLPPKTDALYRVRAQGLRPGDLRVRCQLLTDDLQTPVMKEESTRVYADE
jgi:uncharacterized repeat protein (TIGR01451 family)